VFVNLWGGRVGHAMSYHAVDEVVRRTRRRVGFHFTPHQLRHTYATVARRGGVPVEIVSKLLCHRSVQTTSDIYLHTSPEDLRVELERAPRMTGPSNDVGAMTSRNRSGGVGARRSSSSRAMRKSSS
jgi:integrase/recombinase XerD